MGVEGIDASILKLVVIVVGTIITYNILKIGKKVLSKLILLGIALAVVLCYLNYIGM